MCVQQGTGRVGFTGDIHTLSCKTRSEANTLMKITFEKTLTHGMLFFIRHRAYLWMIGMDLPRCVREHTSHVF